VRIWGFRDRCFQSTRCCDQVLLGAINKKRATFQVQIVCVLLGRVRLARCGLCNIRSTARRCGEMINDAFGNLILDREKIGRTQWRIEGF
jgi:hypothetical protein